MEIYRGTLTTKILPTKIKTHKITHEPKHGNLSHEIKFVYVNNTIGALVLLEIVLSMTKRSKSKQFK